jgi:3-oxoadipate enol-lactonase
MPLANNNGVRISWQEQGSGTPVVLIMGHLYSSAMWYPMLPALAAEHRVISFDNRGTGKSGSTRRASITDLVNDTLAVMDAAGVQRAHIFGVSMGGGIALELAIQHPDRATSLLLGCTCILTAEKPRAPRFMRVLYYVPMPILRLLMGRGDRLRKGYGSAAKPEAIAADLAVLHREKYTPSGVAAQAGAIANYTNTKEAVAKLHMPALVLHGDEDSVVPYAWGVELAETLPNSRLVTFEGAGHNFFVAAPEKSKEVVVNFIRDVDQKA